jgi:hypothetical protein
MGRCSGGCCSRDWPRQAVHGEGPGKLLRCTPPAGWRSTQAGMRVPPSAAYPAAASWGVWCSGRRRGALRSVEQNLAAVDGPAILAGDRGKPGQWRHGETALVCGGDYCGSQGVLAVLLRSGRQAVWPERALFAQPAGGDSRPHMSASRAWRYADDLGKEVLEQPGIRVCQRSADRAQRCRLAGT